MSDWCKAIRKVAEEEVKKLKVDWVLLERLKKADKESDATPAREVVARAMRLRI
jgi:hypothetical protein